ncbi:MAG: TraR/DksA family transcriptional regulator [Acidimicrobiia bacterium]
MSGPRAVADRLVARRAQLAAELEWLTAPPETGSTVAFGKRIGDGTTEAVERLSTTATARSISASLADIERALAKIDSGSYGECDDCGQPIGETRLQALPATSRCIDCSRWGWRPPGGRRQQLWQATVTRDSDGKPAARGQVRLQNLDDLEAIGGTTPDAT